MYTDYQGTLIWPPLLEWRRLLGQIRDKLSIPIDHFTYYTWEKKIYAKFPRPFSLFWKRRKHILTLDCIDLLLDNDDGDDDDDSKDKDDLKDDQEDKKEDHHEDHHKNKLEDNHKNNQEYNNNDDHVDHQKGQHKDHHEDNKFVLLLFLLLL